MSEEFWRSTLARGGFDGPGGHVVYEEAKKKLGALSKKLPLDLVADIFRFYLKHASWDFFNRLKKTKDEHAATLVDVIADSKHVGGRLLCASYEAGGADGLREAAAFVALVARTTNVPGMLKSLAKNWAKFDAVALAPSAAAVVQRQEAPSDEIVLFYALIYVAARTSPKHAAIAETAKRHAKWGDEEVLDRTLSAANRDR